MYRQSLDSSRLHSVRQSKSGVYVLTYCAHVLDTVSSTLSILVYLSESFRRMLVSECSEETQGLSPNAPHTPWQAIFSLSRHVLPLYTLSQNMQICTNTITCIRPHTPIYLHTDSHWTQACKTNGRGRLTCKQTASATLTLTVSFLPFSTFIDSLEPFTNVTVVAFCRLTAACIAPRSLGKHGLLRYT
jgi:hypothetical protein